MLRPNIPGVLFTLALATLGASIGCGGGGGTSDGGTLDASADTATPGDGASGDGGNVDASADVARDSGPPHLVQAGGNASVGHSCALRSDGTIWCWGLDDNGQLGIAGAAPDTCPFDNGSGSVNFPCAKHPVQVAGITNATSVTNGNGHTCALLADGTVWCWGVNDVGQLGIGAADPSPHRMPTMVLGGVRSVSAGAFHTCAAMLDGTVDCWGNDQYGQTGADPGMAGATAQCQVDLDTFPCTEAPHAVPGVTNAVQVSAGRYHACALTNDGKVQCWGLNDVSQLGTANDTMPHFAATTPFLSNVVQVSAGGSHTCAVIDDHSLKCWGWAEYGQIGVPTAMISTCTADTETFGCVPSPTVVPGVQSIAVAAMRAQTCSVSPDGTAQCFGRNDNGQLGIGPDSPDVCSSGIDTFACSRSPLPVQGLTGAIAIGGGDYHGCAVVSAGGAYCWGWNVYGQIGNGATQDQPTAAAVTGLP